VHLTSVADSKDYGAVFLITKMDHTKTRWDSRRRGSIFAVNPFVSRDLKLNSGKY
jgi:hypothetical protein